MAMNVETAEGIVRGNGVAWEKIVKDIDTPFCRTATGSGKHWNQKRWQTIFAGS